MKAISVHQPFASAIALRLKQFETRNRRTHIRGRIAIHAAKFEAQDVAIRSLLSNLDPSFPNFDSLPFGAIIATVDLVDCMRVEGLTKWLDPVELSLGDYSALRWAWKLANVRSLKEPIPFKGHQGWFEIPDSITKAETQT